MSRFIRKRAAPIFLSKKPCPNITEKTDLKQNNNLSNSNVETAFKSNHNEENQNNLNNIDTVKSVPYDPLQISKEINISSQQVQNDTTQLDKNFKMSIEEPLPDTSPCSPSNRTCELKINKKDSAIDNLCNVSSHNSDRSSSKSFLQKPVISSNLTESNNDKSIERLEGIETMCASQTSNYENNLDNFSISVMNKLKTISNPVIPKKRPTPNISKTTCKNNFKNISNKSEPELAICNNNLVSTGVTKESISVNSGELSSHEKSVDKVVVGKSEDNPLCSTDTNTFVEINNEGTQLRKGQIMKRTLPLLPSKRPSPNLKQILNKQGGNIYSKDSVEPLNKVIKLSSNYCAETEEVHKDIDFTKGVLININSDYNKSSLFNSINNVLEPNNLIESKNVENCVKIDDGINFPGLNEFKDKEKDSNSVPNINKFIKKRIGPNLVCKTPVVKKSELNISHKLDQTQKSDLKENLLGQDIIDSKTKELNFSENPDVSSIEAPTSFLPSSLKPDAKGVLRVYLNCWPSYPLSEVDDPFHEGDRVEDVGKVSIFMKKKHKIAYWDLKRIIDFQNTPKNWVNINFNKLIKEEFKEPNEDEKDHENCEENYSEETLNSLERETLPDDHCSNNFDRSLSAQLSFESNKEKESSDHLLSESTISELSDGFNNESSFHWKPPDPKSDHFNVDYNPEIDRFKNDKEVRNNLDNNVSENVVIENSNYSDEKLESSGRRKKIKTPKKIEKMENGIMMTADKSESDGGKRNQTSKEGIEITKNKTKKRKKSKNQTENELDKELGNLSSELSLKNKKSYGFRPKKPLKNVENYDEDDEDKPEDIFSNSEPSESDFEAELENEINGKKLTVKIGRVIKQKRIKKPKENQTQLKRPKEKAIKEKNPKEKNTKEKVKKTEENVSNLNKNKFDEEGNCLEPEKLELKDFIYYTPKSQPMTQEAKNETKINLEENVVEEEKTEQEDEENSGPKLIVKDGKIIVDPNSTKIKQTSIIQYKIEKIEKPKDINDPWELRETMKFYASLWKYGIDYSILVGTFPNKSRESIKRKFNFEQKNNHSLLSKTLTKQLDIKAVLREIVLIDCLNKMSSKRNKDKNKKEVNPRSKAKHCLVNRPKKKPVNRPKVVPEQVALDCQDDSQMSMSSFLSENEVIISDDIHCLNMQDIITLSTNVVYKDMNIVESVSFHPSALKPVDINVTIRHDSDDTPSFDQNDINFTIKHEDQTAPLLSDQTNITINHTDNILNSNENNIIKLQSNETVFLNETLDPS